VKERRMAFHLSSRDECGIYILKILLTKTGKYRQMKELGPSIRGLTNLDA
jgi:hypothetical protein